MRRRRNSQNLARKFTVASGLAEFVYFKKAKRKFNGANKSKRRRYIHRDKDRNAATCRKQNENYDDNGAKGLCFLRERY